MRFNSSSTSGIDDVRRPAAFEQRGDVVDHDVGHLLAHLDGRAAEMRERSRRSSSSSARDEPWARARTRRARRRRSASLFSARTIAASSMIGPRAVLMMNAVFFIRPSSRAPIWWRVPALSGECSETKSDSRSSSSSGDVGQARLALLALGLAARRPVQHAHAEALGAARHRLADQPAAADQPDGLAPDVTRRADGATARRGISRRAPCGRPPSCGAPPRASARTSGPRSPRW